MYPRANFLPQKTVPYSGELPRWLNLAWKLSFDSTHPQFKMGAVVVRSGSILSLAANHYAWRRHCEVRSLSRVEDATGSIVYVMRENRRVSKPCRTCFALLKARKVKKAVYINTLGQIEEMRV